MEAFTHTDVRTPVFTAALVTVAETWRQPRCPSTEDWIKTTWYICTVQYHSATRKDETLPLVTARTDLENITLSETRQSEKAKNHMILFICRM